MTCRIPANVIFGCILEERTRSMRKALISILTVIVAGLLALVVGEIVAARYFNAIALFGVTSVFLWFALHRRRPPDEKP